MVFANIYSRLNELEQKIASLSGVNTQVGSSGPVESVAPVDLTPLNNRVDALEGKYDALPTSFVSQQDITNQYEKINQITAILAQFNVQLSNLVEKVNALEARSDAAS